MQLLTVGETARLLRVSEKTVYRWVHEERLPAYRVGQHYRFSRADLLEWATTNGLRVAPEVFQAAEATNGAGLPTVREALEQGGVFHNLPGEDKPAVLKAVVERMPIVAPADRAFLLEVLLAREALGSTAIGDGVAIPHVRTPIVLHIEAPLMSLCFLAQPVEFGSLDGRPVHALFAMVSPTVRAHLHLLSRLAFLLKSPVFADAVRDRAPAGTVLRACAEVEKTIPAKSGTP